MNPSSSADRPAPGDTIRALRKNGRMTLSDMSSRTGLAISTLSKVEKGRTALSYDKLMRISRALGVGMAQLIDVAPRIAGGANARRAVHRRGDGQWVETRGYRRLPLATELLSKRFMPRIEEIRVRTLREFFSEFGDYRRQPGEEFVHVLEGEIELHSELYAPLRLQAGESVYFDGDAGHACLKASDEICRCLVVSSLRAS